MKICSNPQCKKELPDEAKFCRYCRRDVSNVRPKGEPSSVPPAPRPHPSIAQDTRILFVVLAILAVLVFIAVSNMERCIQCHNPIIGASYEYNGSGRSGYMDQGCAYEFYGSERAQYYKH